MYKQSPGRNHRSKGVKLKHVLQVCLLLAVCFWLIYQVKRSHDKKKEFDETDAKFPIKTESSNELVKLGRKDLRIEGLDSVNKKHREEPEDETVEEEEEGIKPEEEDPEMEDNAKEKNDGLKEDGEDEVDGRDHDHDQEKSDLEVDQEDIVDEDKEREEDDEKETEERDSKEKDNQVEEESSLEDHDHDEDSSSSHEAREEHYKADDASSAVTHDTGVTNAENESDKLEQQAEHVVDQSTTTLKEEDAKMDGEDSPLNTTNNEEKDDDSISSVSNSTRMEGLTDNSESASHSIEVSTQTHDLLLQKGTQTVTQEHDVTLENTTSGGSDLSVSSSQQNSNSADMVDNNQIDSNSIFSLKNDGADWTPVDSSNMSGDRESSLTEKVDQGNATMEDNVELPLKDDNPTEVQKADTSDEIGTTDEGMDASISENLEEVQDDPIDTSDSSTHLEEKHIRTDLETLPEIQTEGSTMEDAAAE